MVDKYSTSTHKRTVLVTGGSRGIGRAIAIKMASEGYTVCLTYVKSTASAHEVVDKIRSQGGHALALQMELADPSSIQQVIQQIFDQYSGIDILVNNAAMAQEKPFDEITIQDWDTMLNVNLRGAFLCSQAVVEHMVRGEMGRIINISSIGGQWGGWRQVHYAAAKAGLLNLTRSVARIYAKYNITANAIAPGLIHTEMIEQELHSTEGQKKINAIPLGRLGLPEDVANCVAFLASPQAAYITGQTINVNGGMYLK